MDIKGFWNFLRRPTVAGNDVIIVTDGIDSHADVAFSGTPASGEYLVNNGAVWRNAAAPASNYVKSAFDEVTTNVSKSGTGYVNLLSVAITPDSASSIFIVHFTAAGDNSTTSDYNTRFRLSFGPTGSETVKRSTHIFSDSTDEAGSCALVYRGAASSAAEHTFLIDWEAEGGTARIQAVTQSNEHHASLVVEEVKA